MESVKDIKKMLRTELAHKTSDEELFEKMDGIKYDLPEEIINKDGWTWILSNPPFWLFFHALRLAIGPKRPVLDDMEMRRLFRLLFNSWLRNGNRTNTAELFYFSYILVCNDKLNILKLCGLDCKKSLNKKHFNEMFAYTDKDNKLIVLSHEKNKQ